MNNQLMMFEGHNVEILELDGVIYFNPYHVGECLNLGDSAIRMAMLKMNENQARLIKNSDVKDIDFRKLNNAGEKFLTESGVYKLVFKSEKKEAEKFADWVADEVLPSIRKTGAYITEKANPEMLREKANEIERLDTINKSLELVSPLLDAVGVNNNIKLLVAKTFFSKAGIDIPVEIEAEESYYDTKQIGAMIGMYSKSGKPAFGAVGEILKLLEITTSEKQSVWESNGSWQGTVMKYTKSVIEKVSKWIKDNGYPADIPSQNKTFHVFYKTLEEVIQ